MHPLSIEKQNTCVWEINFPKLTYLNKWGIVEIVMGSQPKTGRHCPLKRRTQWRTNK